MFIKRNLSKVYNLSEIQKENKIEIDEEYRVWKITGNSNIFLIDGENPLIIDAGDRPYLDSVKEEINKIINPNKIKFVIMTHLHYDHIGCVDLFPNAKIFASDRAIEDYKNDPYGTVLNNTISKLIENKEIFSFSMEKKWKNSDGFPFLKFISTPGHTNGSVCILFEKQKILFTGDTYFKNGVFGRVDLPTSDPEKIEDSLRKISQYFQNKDYLICPGHDY